MVVVGDVVVTSVAVVVVRLLVPIVAPASDPVDGDCAAGALLEPVCGAADWSAAGAAEPPVVGVFVF